MHLSLAPFIKAQSILRGLAVAASLYFVVVFIGLALIRMAYPYELEWTEGAMLDQVYWIVQGRWEYGPPSLQFIPICYNPLYLYMTAWLSKTWGVSFLAPRFISMVATLGTMFLIYKLVHINTGQKSAGWIAAGLFAATFRFSGAWLDLAKVDSLFLLLVLAAHLIGRRQSWPAWVASGGLYVMAYYTKQLALPLILIMAVASLIQYRGRTWPQWAAAAAAGALIFVWLEINSAGWFSFYTIRALSYQERLPTIWSFWKQIIKAFWPGLLAIGLAAGLVFFRRKWPEFKPVFWQDLVFAGALIAISWSVFFKIWTYDNGFIPACAGLALLIGWTFGFTRSWVEQRQIQPWGGWLHLGTGLLVLVQFALLFYSPIQQLPTPQARAAAARFNQFVKELPGEVLILHHAFVSVNAGKPPYFHSVTFADPTAWAYPARSAADAQKRELTLEVWRQAQREQAIPWIILDSRPEYWYPHYVVVEDISAEYQSMEPVTGAPSKPRFLLAPNPIVNGGAAPLVDPKYDFLFQEDWQIVTERARYLHGQQGVMQVLLDANHAYQIEISLLAPCLADKPHNRWINVFWNDEPLGEVVIPVCGSANAAFNLPAASINSQGNQLIFRLPPEAEPLSEKNAFGFTTIHFTQQP